METLIQNYSNFLAVLPTEGLDRLRVLTNFVSPRIYGSIADCTTFDDAIQTLKALYTKPSNEIFARHLLATRWQKSGENLDEFLQALKTLSKACNHGRSLVFRFGGGLDRAQKGAR